MTDAPLTEVDSTPQPSAPVVAKNRSGSFSIGFAVLLAVVAVAAAGYVYLQQQAQFAQLQNSLQTYKQQLTTQSGQVSDLLETQQKSLQQSQQALAQQLDTLSAELRPQLRDQRAALEEQKNRLEKLSEADRSDWQLAEADYLLQLAHQRVLLMRDTAGVAELLQSVDQIIAGINNSGLLDVRKNLAEEIAALKTLPTIDRQGIYLRIAAIEKQANSLPIVIPGNDVFDVQDGKNNSESISPDWTDRLFAGLKSALNKLGAYVRVQHRDMPLPPTLAPEQENLVRRSLQLQFEQAQFALLAGNETLYVASLEKARSWLFDLYLADRDATQKVIAEIDALIKQPVEQTLPTIGAAHQALQKYIQQRHAASVANNQPVKSSQAKAVDPKVKGSAP